MLEKPVRQQRSREKRDRILRALEALLRLHPFEGLGVQEVARAAQVPAATLYQRFRNHDVMGSMLLALYYERTAAWARRPREPDAAAAASLQGALAGIAADAWDQVAALGHVMRPAYLYSRSHPDRVGPEWQRLEQIAESGFRAFVAGQAAQLPPQDPDESGRALCLLFNSMLLGPLLHGEHARWAAPDGRRLFIVTLTALAGRYLACPR